MFYEVSVIGEQGSVLDRIDFNGMRGRHKKKGVLELEKAEEQKNSKSLKCIASWSLLLLCWCLC